MMLQAKLIVLDRSLLSYTHETVTQGEYTFTESDLGMMRSSYNWKVTSSIPALPQFILSFVNLLHFKHTGLYSI